MLAWSLEVLDRAPAVGEIVVAEPEGVSAAAVLPGARRRIVGVRGGAERSHSVRNAVAALSADVGVVLVHDAARPLLTAEIVADCLAAMEDPAVDAAVAAAPVTDTVKEAVVAGDSAQPVVSATLDRSRLWSVQTPQVFRRAVLERVLAQPDEVLAAATDDASLVEATGGRVVLVPSPRANMKVTTPEDLRLAELLLSDRTGPGGGARKESR